MKTSTALNGFLKGLLIVLAAAGMSYIGDAANLAPLVGTTLATVIAGVVSALESEVRKETGRGLFGATKVG